MELGALSLLGGVLGVASGYLLASLLLPDVAASLRGVIWRRSTGTVEPESMVVGWRGWA